MMTPLPNLSLGSSESLIGLRILVLLGRLPWPFDDGWKMRSGHLVLELRRRGADVQILAFDDRSGVSDDANHPLGKIETIARGAGYRIASLIAGAVGATPFSVINYRSADFSRRVRELSRNDSFDALLVEDVVMAQYAKDASVHRRFLDMHNIESHLLERFANVEKNLAKRWYARMTARKLMRYEREIAGTFRAIFVCSDDDGRRLKEICTSSNAVVVPNGVDVEYFRRASEGRNPGSLCFVGSMDYHANISAARYLVNEILPLVRAVRPDVTVTIVGKNPTPEVLRLAGDGVVVTGSVPDVRPFLERTEVVLAPLLVGGGTRLKILEAMAMGSAVVSTTVGCEGLQVRDGHDIVIADNVESLSFQILELLANPHRRAELGRNARTTVETRYSWPAVSVGVEIALTS